MRVLSFSRTHMNCKKIISRNNDRDFLETMVNLLIVVSFLEYTSFEGSVIMNKIAESMSSR